MNQQILMLMINVGIESLIFFIYGILSPIYYIILKDKVSNERAFLTAWILAPHLVSFVYSKSILLDILLIISLFCDFILLYKNALKVIYSGSPFLVIAIVIQIFLKSF